jgi:hypothetical protein
VAQSDHVGLIDTHHGACGPGPVATGPYKLASLIRVGWRIKNAPAGAAVLVLGPRTREATRAKVGGVGRTP